MLSGRSSSRSRDMIRLALESERDPVCARGGNAVDKRVEAIMKQVMEIVEHADNLVLHNGTSSSRPLDQKVLLRLLGRDLLGSSRTSKKLEAAMRWRRPDIARQVLEESKFRQDSTVEDIVTECLMDERPEFVEVFIQSGFSFR